MPGVWGGVSWLEEATLIRVKIFHHKIKVTEISLIPSTVPHGSVDLYANYFTNFKQLLRLFCLLLPGSFQTKAIY